MARSLTKPSTPRLSEVARHLVIPAGIVSTGWPAVEAKCREWGDSFDVWQSGLGRVILGKRADGKYAATVGGITLSIPRQVAKTFLVGRIVFALCALIPGLTVLWTAHRTRTATNTFRNLSAFARRKKVAPYIASVRSTNGEQEITFANGSRIMFGAREAGFGRGFDEVDIEVFDEAQILSVKALEDMVAATNQTRQSTGALLFYMGTPPRPSDPGEVFSERRNEALALKGQAPDFAEPVASGNATYVECSADPNVGKPGEPSLDDEAQVKVANPSYPHRTPLESIQRLRANLKDDASWRREGLGVWDPGAGELRTIKAATWDSLHNLIPPTEGRVALGVKFSVDGRRVALAAVRRPDSGPLYGEVIDERYVADGIGWLVDLLVPLSRRVAVIVIDGKSGAGDLRQRLADRKARERNLVFPTTAQVVEAHATTLGAINDGTLTHGNQAGLNASVAVAKQRRIGTLGGWGWEPIGDGDPTPLDAITFATWGAMTKAKPKSGQGWKAVVG